LKKLRGIFHFPEEVNLGERLIELGLVESELGEELGLAVGDKIKDSKKDAKIEAGDEDKFRHRDI
jgi:hypothetical protein